MPICTGNPHFRANILKWGIFVIAIAFLLKFTKSIKPNSTIFY